MYEIHAERIYEHNLCTSIRLSHRELRSDKMSNLANRVLTSTITPLYVTWKAPQAACSSASYSVRPSQVSLALRQLHVLINQIAHSNRCMIFRKGVLQLTDLVVCSLHPTDSWSLAGSRDDVSYSCKYMQIVFMS